jgi:hypothetical protein
MEQLHNYYDIIDFNEKNNIIKVKFKDHPQPIDIVLTIDALDNTYVIGEDLHNYIMTFQPVIHPIPRKKIPAKNKEEIYKLVNKKEKDKIDLRNISDGLIIKRNMILMSSDWSQLQDANDSLEEDEKILWKEYRQKLRDMTDQPGWPLDVDWPKRPHTLETIIYE